MKRGTLLLLIVFAAAIMPWRLVAADLPALPDIAETELHGLIDTSTSLAVPLIPLTPTGTRLEADWADALAAALAARQEVHIRHGRVDVLSASYAIEVDWFRKWHEGLGQAQHYGIATGQAPAVALILKPDEWPLDAHTLSKLSVIHDVADAIGVEVILLRFATPQRTAMQR